MLLNIKHQYDGALYARRVQKKTELCYKDFIDHFTQF